MMRLLNLVGLVLVLSAAMVDGSCRERFESWTPMTFSTLFRQHAIRGLIQGRVTHIYPPQHIPHFGREVITAQIEIQCIFRGSSDLERAPLINVTGFGENNDCVNTMVTQGDSYLIFVEPFQHANNIQYVVQEHNLQRGAFQAVNVKLSSVMSVYECRRAVGAVTTTLSPWRSRTPVKQLPWIILPEDFKPPGSEGIENNASFVRPSFLFFLSTIIAIIFL